MISPEVLVQEDQVLIAAGTAEQAHEGLREAAERTDDEKRGLFALNDFHWPSANSSTCEHVIPGGTYRLCRP